MRVDSGNSLHSNLDHCFGVLVLRSRQWGWTADLVVNRGAKMSAFHGLSTIIPHIHITNKINKGKWIQNRCIRVNPGLSNIWFKRFQPVTCLKTAHIDYCPIELPPCQSCWRHSAPGRRGCSKTRWRLQPVSRYFQWDSTVEPAYKGNGLEIVSALRSMVPISRSPKLLTTRIKGQSIYLGENVVLISGFHCIWCPQ